jgi:ATP-binding cassette subfamily B protein
LRLRDAHASWADVGRLLERAAPPSGAAPALPQSSEIVLDGVSFGYGHGAVLTDISCRYEPGGITAIVGRSGAGKSALAKLIAGLAEPDAGTIRVGGVDLADLPAAERTRLVSLVFQDTELLDGTLAANIAAGRPGASQTEIRTAAHVAGCHEFIARLPDGYETVVRAAAPGLSLGERQRIAIARALIGSAPIVVFDECTASLDPAAERVVNGAIETLAERATVVLITHRLGSVRGARRIVVLAAGRIVQTGTHAELAGAPGEYARLWAAYDAAHAWRTAG